MSFESKVHLFNEKYDQMSTGLVKNLFQQNVFSDVTLACEDGKVFNAHKIILSSSSPVLQKILIEYNESNPILYFGDICSENMEYILKFIYLGEVSLEEKLLDSLLNSAKKLKINGLYTEFFETKKRINTEEKLISTIKQEKIVNQEVKTEESDNQTDNCDEVSVGKELIDTEESNSRESNSDLGINRKNKMKVGVESTTKPMPFNCMYCDYKTSAKEYLRKHTNAIHEGVTYPCNKCDYKATQTVSLLQHKT